MKKITDKIIWFYFLLIVTFFSFNCSGQIKENNILVYNSEKGFIKSDGYRFSKLNTDIPRNLITVDLASDDSGNYYLTTLQSGIFYSDDTASWKNITPSLFKRRTGLSGNSEFRKISTFDFNDANLIAATKHNLYLSKDRGANWKEVSLAGIERGNWRYFTAVALNRNKPLAGTSTNGLFLKSSAFRDISAGLPSEPTYGKNYFYESVSEIAVNKTDIYAGFFFGKGLFMSPDSGKTWKNLELPLVNKELSAVQCIKFHNDTVYVSTSEAIFFKKSEDKLWQKHSSSQLISEIFKDPCNLIALININGINITVKNDLAPERLLIKDTNASNKKAIYTSVWTLRKKSNVLLQTMKKCGINSIVIDLKDDTGYFFMKTSNATANEINAVNNKIGIEKYIKLFHDNGIHVIARMVVFKDKQLYNSYNNKYAIWDSKTGKPWKGSVVHEFWCDPFSSFVQNYNIELAKDAEKAGFDEIQFDYIRFPTDGPIFRCEFRNSTDTDAYKSEALADFLQKAQAELKIPVSTDIYGFNAWYNFGNIMGQDIEIFALYVDAISPMMYPSHYGNKFYAVFSHAERPFQIVYHNSIRAHYLSGNRVHIRPYIQAFNLLSPTWGPGYINTQLNAIEKSKTDGYIFWNAAGEYDMLLKAAKSR
ncbi:MAG: hypothetical protein JW982_09845 [Spirochaetes bacterium]|nr:hypothetical protein [Spirochaetota bacterium]